MQWKVSGTMPRLWEIDLIQLQKDKEKRKMKKEYAHPRKKKRRDRRRLRENSLFKLLRFHLCLELLTIFKVLIKLVKKTDVKTKSDSVKQYINYLIILSIQ